MPEGDAATPLTLRTLGSAGLFARGDADLLLAPGKPLALLIHLALTPGRRISRESLVELLWGDLEPERGRSALRQALFHLRRMLGEHALPGTEELTLARAVDVDRDRFLAAIERGDLDGALACYGGEFLPTFGVPGGAHFEQWADLERNRLRIAFLRCAELVVRRQLNQSHFKEAQRLARRARDHAPASDAAWRLLLETVVAGRDFVSAGVEADALEKWASAEDVALEPATRLAIARARQVTPAPSESRDDVGLIADLTGREREFSAIITAWDAARSGPARHLHLTAQAGLGKTRLLRDATARLRAGGALVVELRGAPGDRDIPYAFAADLAMSVAALPGAAAIAPASAAALIALNPALSAHFAGQADAAVGEEALRRRVHAITDLVHAVADEQPIVLVIDDLHWVDRPSYQLLEGLWGRLNGAHVLCLTAARPERLPAGDNIKMLPLSALALAQVASLVSALGALPDGAPWSRDFVRGLHGATRGSPLLILETIRLAIDEEILIIDRDEWRCTDAARLASLLQAGEALRQRVRALPQERGWVLALLATAGTPLPVAALAAAARRPPEELTELLAALERQGLVTRTTAGWLPAHDEIAEAGREALEAERRAAANRALGEALTVSAGSDVHQLLRGARHLAAAGDDRLVGRHFRRYVLLAREHNDRRSFSELAAELLAENPQSPRVAALTRALPAHWRFGLSRPATQRIAAAVALLMTGVSGVAMYAHNAHEATLQRVFYLDSTQSPFVIPVRASEWDGRTAPLVATRRNTTMTEAALAFPELPPAISPDRRSVAWTRDSGDSTTLDIWIRTPTGTRRLTREFRDDLVNSWVPDGSAIVGMTNRWSSRERGGYKIAVFDTATGEARQVSRGPGHDRLPFVSPDGTRIAFLREREDGASSLCVTPFDGRDAADCRLVGGFSLSQLVGWADAEEIIVSLDSAGTRPLFRYDWQRNERTLVLGPYLYASYLSPDRRWVVGAVRRDGFPGFRDWIIPIERPAQARMVDQPRGGPGRVRWWEGVPDRSGLIDRIEFTDTTHTILAGVGTRLRIRALTADGAEVPVRAPVRWMSSDTLVATVDSLGDVRPRTAGTVRITASLAGWRSTSRMLRIAGEPAKTVLNERWDDGWRARWITFGDPQPLVTQGPGMIRGFWNNGDGSYPSMAILREAFSAKAGLGVEIRLSTPLTKTVWQRARSILVAGIDTAAFNGADQRKAPPFEGRVFQNCGATYPAEDGGPGQTRLAGMSGTSQVLELGPASDRLRSGAWWTLRIQIFPDGRCGLAVNDQVVWLSPEPIQLDGDFRLRLGDESAGTKLLHGPLQIWTGVRTDINWSQRPR